jgi:hypothetical protein
MNAENPLISEDLARRAAARALATGRTVDGQVEFWARLGCVVEGALMRGSPSGEPVDSVFCGVSSLDGVRRSLDEIRDGPGPVFSADPLVIGGVVACHADGTEERGRFVGGKFVGEVIDSP